MKGWLGASGATAELPRNLSACLSPRVQTRRSADWLSVEMSQDGHQVAILTAELTVAQRAGVIQRFRDGKEKVLIATNVCARGTSGKPNAPCLSDGVKTRFPASGSSGGSVGWSKGSSPTCGVR